MNGPSSAYGRLGSVIGVYKLVVIRPGESNWNKESRFTGWTDVDLSGRDVRPGRCLKDTVARFLPFWHETLALAVKTAKKVVAARGNRASGPWSSISTTSPTRRSSS